MIRIQRLRKSRSTSHDLDSQVRAAFTLIEFLVVIAICAILMSMTIPALLASRAAARRNVCSHHMEQLYFAVNAYQDAHGTFPAGVISLTDPVPPEKDGNFPSWLVPLLPFLDFPVLAQKMEGNADISSLSALEARQYRIPLLLCPSDDAPAVGNDGKKLAQSNYAGCHDHRGTAIASSNDGLLTLNQRFASTDVADGSCCTFLGGEFRRSPTDLGWASGTRGTLRNTGTPINQTLDGRQSELLAAPLRRDGATGYKDNAVQDAMPVKDQNAGDQLPPESLEAGAGPAVVRVPRSSGDPGGFGSFHAGGSNFLMGDGQIRMISESIDRHIYELLGNRNDGTLVPPKAF